MLFQMYVVKMGLVNNTVFIQDNSVAHTFYLQIKGEYDVFKGEYRWKGSSCVSNQMVAF